MAPIRGDAGRATKPGVEAAYSVVFGAGWVAFFLFKMLPATLTFRRLSFALQHKMLSLTLKTSFILLELVFIALKRFYTIDMKSKVSLLLLLLLWAKNAYAWDSDNATNAIFEIFYIPLFILFLISYKWAKNSTLVKIVVSVISLGLMLVLLALAVMFHEDRHPVFFKTVGGFVLLIIFTFARKKDKQEEEF